MANLIGKTFVHSNELQSGEFEIGKFHVSYVIRPDVLDAEISSDRLFTPADASFVKVFLTQLFSFEYRHYPFKIFGIGLPRTGTTSLAVALRRLGIFACTTPHGWPPEWQERSIAVKRPTTTTR